MPYAQQPDPANGCPKCHGPLWDNRVGKKNPKQPDYKCKDKACDGVIWPPKDAAYPRNGAVQPHPVDGPANRAANAKQEFSSGPHISGLDTYTDKDAPPDAAADVESGSVYPRLQKMFSVYDVCLDHVLTNVAPKLNKSDVGSSPESVAAICATLYISATDAGLTR
jgi:hypothetical protein